MGALRRYELDRRWDVDFDKLSGGQQARLQILLLELGGSTLLALDEPTTTSTSRRRKRSNGRSRRTRARWWRSRTTAGFCTASTGS